jgi:hypothetical protein
LRFLVLFCGKNNMLALDFQAKCTLPSEFLRILGLLDDPVRYRALGKIKAIFKP